MTSYAAGDRVEARYPLSDTTDRDAWPWLPATVLGPTDDPGEWEVEIEVDELAVTEGGEVLYPLCFRGPSEIRRRVDTQLPPHQDHDRP